MTTSADTGYYSVYRVMGSEETVKNLALESRTELSWLAWTHHNCSIRQGSSSGQAASVSPAVKRQSVLGSFLHQNAALETMIWPWTSSQPSSPGALPPCQQYTSVR